MKVLFDTSMLYIDNPVKRGIYYFTLNLLKYLKKQSGLRIIEYPIALHTGLNSIIRMPYDITKLLIYKNKNIDLIFIPHSRTFTHALSLHVVPKPINIVIHDVFS